MTRDDIDAAKDWLGVQRCVVHPGPIETIYEALNVLEGQIRAREMRQTSRDTRTPFKDTP